MRVRRGCAAGGIALAVLLTLEPSSAFSPTVSGLLRTAEVPAAPAQKLRSLRCGSRALDAAGVRQRRRACSGGLVGATCGVDSEQDALVRLLSLAASTNRGRSATLDQKYDIENAISDLEESGSITRQMNMAASPLLNGKWALVYASERETRSSPFFWAFRKALKGVEQPFPVLPGELSESFFAITDGLPFYSVGRAQQTIAGVGTAKATLVSSVQVTIRIFDALVPALDGFVTTSSEYRPTSASAALLKVLTTEVRDSTLTQVPVVGGFVEGFKFPTSEALEQVRAGSSEVQVEHTYLSESVRIVRNADRQVFVYIKDEASDPFGDFDEEFGADASEEANPTPSKPSSAPPPPSAASDSTPRVELGIAGAAFSGDNEPAWVEFDQFSEDVSPD